MPAHELYDMTGDPEEKHNLIADSKQARILAQLRSLVKENWANGYRPAKKK